MWHRKRRHRLGVKTHHRKALLRNLVRALVLHRQIETTVARAKETSIVADRMVTLAKQGTLHARRQLIRRLGSPQIAKLFMEKIAPRFSDRLGGYTRVLKTGYRPGDGAEKALVEFSVPIEVASPEKKAKPKKEKQVKPAKPVLSVEKKEKAPAPEALEKTAKPVEKEKEKPKEKPETEKRGGFLSKLRKFLKGDEN